MLRSYKKRFLIMSKNWFVLKLILNHILDLKRVGPYELRGIRLSKTIILKKKSGKKT